MPTCKKCGKSYSLLSLHADLSQFLCPDCTTESRKRTTLAESIASPATASLAWTVVRDGVSSSPIPRPFPVPQDFGKNPKLTYQEAADCVASQKLVQQFDFVALCRTYYKPTSGRRGIAWLAVLGVLIVAGVLWGTLRFSIGPFWIAVCVGIYLAVIHSTKPESSSDAMPSLDKFALVVGAGTKLFLLPLSTTGQRFNCDTVLMLDLSRLKVEALQRGRSLSVSEANGGQPLLLDRFGLALKGVPKDFTFEIFGQQTQPAQDCSKEPQNVRFLCPQCSGSIAIDKSGVGMSVACPHCSAMITVPSQISSK